MDFSERRELLRLLVDEVVFYDGEHTIKKIIPVVPLHPASRRLGCGAGIASQSLAARENPHYNSPP